MRPRSRVALAGMFLVLVSGVRGEAGGDASDALQVERCRADEVPPSTFVSRLLGIAARQQDPRRPPEGWCGETAIQEALLYHGVFAPQPAINAAGKPAHPDLYANELPTALAAFGMDIETWPAGVSRPDLKSFLGWVRLRIEGGTPVLCGVKINPTKHPEWSADHFAVAVGTIGDAILFNGAGAGDERVFRSEAQLGSTSEPGFGFASAHGTYVGIAVRDRTDRAKGAPAVRLFVESENASNLRVIVKCEQLVIGRKYALVRGTLPRDPRTAVTIARFTAKAAAEAFRADIPPDAPSVFSCRRE